MVYEEARKILSKYKLKSPNDFFNKRSEEKYRVLFSKLGIPAGPHKIYKDNGWISWPDFLGYDLKEKDHKKKLYKKKLFIEMKKMVKGLNISSKSEWSKWYNGNLLDKPDFPEHFVKYPESAFRELGWKGWADFLGYEPERKKK